MAVSKSWRDIQLRPTAAKCNPHKSCMHSLKDKTKLTKISNGDLLNGYHLEYKDKLIKSHKRLKKLMSRRKLRQDNSASKQTDFKIWKKRNRLRGTIKKEERLNATL